MNPPDLQLDSLAFEFDLPNFEVDSDLRQQVTDFSACYGAATGAQSGTEREVVGRWMARLGIEPAIHREATRSGAMNRGIRERWAGGSERGAQW